jgi:hypothetical protein
LRVIQKLADCGARTGEDAASLHWMESGRTILTGFFKERLMTQKIIEVVGTSKDSFAKAAENAVAEAAKTVRGIRWAHVDSLDMQLEGAKVLLYRATTKIYFDVEH